MFPLLLGPPKSLIVDPRHAWNAGRMVRGNYRLPEYHATHSAVGMRWGPSRGGADGFLKYNQKLEEGERCVASSAVLP